MCFLQKIERFVGKVKETDIEKLWFTLGDGTVVRGVCDPDKIVSASWSEPEGLDSLGVDEGEGRPEPGYDY